jgi:hypothetical protein
MRMCTEHRRHGYVWILGTWGFIVSADERVEQVSFEMCARVALCEQRMRTTSASVVDQRVRRRRWFAYCKHVMRARTDAHRRRSYLTATRPARFHTRAAVAKSYRSACKHCLTFVAPHLPNVRLPLSNRMQRLITRQTLCVHQIRTHKCRTT